MHTVGICDPKATDPSGKVVPYLSAGGHLNLEGVGHPHHTGDLPSLYVSADDTVTSITENDKLTAAAPFDADGSAIIIQRTAGQLRQHPHSRFSDRPRRRDLNNRRLRWPGGMWRDRPIAVNQAARLPPAQGPCVLAAPATTTRPTSPLIT
ncbi:superoxide dismutase family protein [Kibdelosporangium aridum]|uniref:superoxide dismutase family protein n=1 Tax=Kibdelosporangium aridum TaxID=2030 RepID=UPI0037BEDBAE